MLSRRAGFTLIELLIVIGIILLLAGLLFPVFMSARAAGQRAACTSNLRQLTQAVMLYTNDHEECFPENGDRLLWMGRMWRPVIDPYVGSRNTYWCPADGTAIRKFDATSYAYLQSFYHDAADINAGQTAMTTGFSKAYHTCERPPVAQGLADVQYPEKKILLYEWTSNHQRPQRTMWDATGTHLAAFVDGHVERIEQEDLRPSALGDKDPNWTVDGIGGKDVE